MKTLLAFVCVLGVCLAAPAKDDRTKLLKELENMLEKEMEEKESKNVRNVYQVWQDGNNIYTTIQRNTALGDDIQMDVYYTVDGRGSTDLAKGLSWSAINGNTCTSDSVTFNGCFGVANPKVGSTYTFYTKTFSKTNGIRDDGVQGTSKSITVVDYKKKSETDTDALAKALMKLLEKE